MKYFSTFSGIGGFELGIQFAHESLCNADGGSKRRGKENKKRDKREGLLSTKRQDTSSKKRSARQRSSNGIDQRPLCVGYSEIDKYAIEIYQKHFPNHINYGDITKINVTDLPDFDILVGGFPCQAFSIAGKRRGFEDTRGTMFFELARILREKQPRLFVFENVKGLLSHDNGNTFRTIVSAIDELGYDCQWQVLNSKNHGVPQNRERIFIVGHLRGFPGPEIFPFQESNCWTKNSRSQKREEVANTLKAKQGGPDLENSYLIDLKAPTSSSRRGMFSDGKVSKTLDHNCSQGFGKGSVVRKLTPVECERLQGFPDGWTEGLSDTQRYKTLGNAVTVNVIRDIFMQI